MKHVFARPQHRLWTGAKLTLSAVRRSTMGSVLLFTMLTGACSEYVKNPVSDINSLRAHAKKEVEKGPIQPQVVRETIVVEKPKLVVQEQARLDDSFLVLETENVLHFTEGQKGQFLLKVHHLSDKLDSDLEVIQAPKGLSINKQKNEKNVSFYTIEWTPPLYQIPSGKVFESNILELKIKGRSTDPLLNKIQKQKKITILLTKPEMLPKNLKVHSLPEKVKMGQSLTFHITVEIAHLDEQLSEKPILVITPDPMVYTPGVAAEQDASRFIRFVPGNNVEYLGNHQWKFTLILDTQNIAPLKTGFHRFLVKVFSPTGLSTPTQLVRFNIEEDL